MVFRIALVIHILTMLIGFGPMFSFPVIGMVARKDPGALPGLIRVMNGIIKYLATPADFLMPASGAVMILASRGLWNPFTPRNRWLAVAIFLYIVLFALGQGILGPAARRALKAVEAGEFGPEFVSAMDKQRKFGPLAGLLTLTIAILMITKPGCGCPHF